MIADFDAVEDHGVRADPHVMADRDAPDVEALVPDGPFGVVEAVVEAEDAGVRADADVTAEPDEAADDGEGVDGAVRAGADVPGDVGVRGDVGAVPEDEPVREDAREGGDEAVLAERRVRHARLPFALRGALLARGVRRVLPGEEVVPVRFFTHVVTSSRASTRG